jgi:hypothetical protein
MQIDPREEDMIVGDFREEFLELYESHGKWCAMSWYFRQVVKFQSLLTAAAMWLTVFAMAATVGLWMQPFSPVPGVIASLAIVPLSALDAARRTGHLRAGILFGAALGLATFLAGAATTRIFHVPSPPLTVFPTPPAITILVFSAVGAALGRNFRHLGGLKY